MIFCLGCLLFVFAGAQAESAQKTVTIGVFLGGDNYLKIHEKTLISSIEKSAVVPKNFGFKPVISVFYEEDTFVESLEKKKFEYGLSINHDHFLDRRVKLGLEPLGVFKVKEFPGIPYCLVVPKRSSVKNLKDLKGKTAAFPSSRTLFYLITQELGENPLEFFKEIKLVSSGTIGAKQVDDKTVEAALAAYGELMLIKVFNSALDQRLKKIFCISTIPSPPLFKVGALDNSLADQWVRGVFINTEKYPSLAHLGRLKKIFKIWTALPNSNGYKSLQQIRARGDGSKWKSWYEKFMEKNK